MIPAQYMATSLLRTIHRCTPAVALAEDEGGDTDPYRQLGISEDASYSEIMDAFIALSEKYGGDAPRVRLLEAAKEKILDNRLRQRMSGALRPAVSESPFDAKPKKVTPPWKIAYRFACKMFEFPTREYATKVLTLMFGMLAMCWYRPHFSSTCLLINVVSGLGYMYNRGETEARRDENGQIGEIRPMVPKPFYLSCAIVTGIWFAGFFSAKNLIARAVTPPWVPELVLRATLITLGLTFTSLFVKVRPLFA